MYHDLPHLTLYTVHNHNHLMLYTDTLQLSSKVTFTRFASEMCVGRICSHASGICTRRVHASAKPHNKTAARLT